MLLRSFWDTSRVIVATRLEFNVWLSIRAFAKPADIELHEGRYCGDRFHLFSERYTVWLVIFTGTNFREIGQITISEIFAVLIYAIGESGARGDCFRSRLCTAVWIVCLC